MKFPKPLHQLVLCCVLASFPSISSRAQAIIYDNTFATGGICPNLYPTTDNGFNDVLVAPDQSIYAAGCANQFQVSFPYYVAKYKSNGTLETTFGTNGIASIGNPAHSQFVYRMALQPDGKILVCGNLVDTISYIQRIFAARLNANGTADNTFGTNGVFTDANDIYPRANDIEILPDGRIIIVGDGNDYSTNIGFALRLKANGTVDSTYGVFGYFRSDNIGMPGNKYAMTASALQSDGKLVVAGRNFTAHDAAVMRIDTNGTKDATFGVNGVFHLDMSSNDEMATAVEVQSDNKIVFAGGAYVFNTAQNDVFTGRLKTTGVLDSSYGTFGYNLFDLYADINFKSSGVNRSKLLAGNKLLLTGFNVDANGVNGRAMLYQFKANGSLDSSFNQTGIKQLNNLSSTFKHLPQGIANQTDGKIVLAGYGTDISGSSSLLCRVMPTETLQLTSPNGGEVWSTGSTQNITWAYTNINNVNIDYSIDSATTWTTIASNIPCTGTYSWIVPNTNSSKCFVRVKSAASYTEDDSDNKFSIVYPSSINGFKDNNLLLCYPNPANDVLTIKPITQGTAQVQITGIDGKTMYSSNIAEKIILNTSNFAKGLYFVTITADGKSQSQKLMIAH
jgi:uncharacterized delta-60 repeat protein